MYECALMQNYHVYKWHGIIYVSIYAIGYMCGDCGMHIYEDTSRLQINIILLFVFHNIIISSLI